MGAISHLQPGLILEIGASSNVLLLPPTLLTLAITLLRLVGELRGWPWFDKESGYVGITVLPPIFGFYFTLKLWRGGERIDRVGRAFALGLLGLV
jgi:hypothetical protein